MADLEKVIKGIDVCLHSFHCGEDCPYYNVEFGCMEQLWKDALSLLKEQEAHIVTETDFENADIYGFLPAWCEERYVEHVYCECITKGALSEKCTRYWTARPTDEQRKAVKWE